MVASVPACPVRGEAALSSSTVRSWRHFRERRSRSSDFRIYHNGPPTGQPLFGRSAAAFRRIERLDDVPVRVDELEAHATAVGGDPQRTKVAVVLGARLG